MNCINCLAIDICPDKGLNSTCKGFTVDEAMEKLIAVITRVMADRFTYHDDDGTVLDNFEIPCYNNVILGRCVHCADGEPGATRN